MTKKKGELSQRYTGAVAAEYDCRRRGQEKWAREQELMSALLQRFPRESGILDVPVGTGRFVEFYKANGFRVTGMDVSEDMLMECSRNAAESEFEMNLVRGSAFAIGVGNNSVDISVCIRFLNWLERPEFKMVIGELARVSRRYVVLGVRHLVPFRQLGPSRLARQCLMRLRGPAARSGLVYHKQRDVRRAFAENHLTVSSEHCVEERWDGTDYLIYVLEVNS